MCRSIAEGGRRCPCTYAPRPGHNAGRRARRALGRLAADGVHVGLAADGERQYWWDAGSGDRCAASRVRPIRDPTSVNWKPAGGLWTSPAVSSDVEPTAPVRSGFHTAWTDFAAADAAGDSHLTEVLATADAISVRISSRAEVEAVCRRWPLQIVDRSGTTLHGWSYEAMARDGVHAVDIVPSPEVRFDDRLYGFDVQTRIWLSPAKFVAGGRSPVSW